MAEVYLVEDDPITLRMAQLILESRSHVIVGTATNASDAKPGIQAAGPDLCIIDISLDHGTSGIDVAEFVIEKIGCPVIIMSADDQPTLPVPFLLKPVSPGRLIEAVDHLLSATVAAGPPGAARLHPASLPEGSATGSSPSASLGQGGQSNGIL